MARAAWMMAFALLGCAPSGAASIGNDASAVGLPPVEKKASGRAMSDSGNSIGQATMTDDGTIVLDLRAEGPNGLRGDARFTYPKSHPKYQEVLRHIGGIKPGEQKPVPPWD